MGPKRVNTMCLHNHSIQLSLHQIGTLANILQMLKLPDGTLKVLVEGTHRVSLSEILEEGDHVLCAISKKKISLQNLNYWNVEFQEAYFSPIEVNKKYKLLKK